MSSIVAGLLPALSVEFLKSRRSRVPWIVAAGFSLAPVVGALFMVILQNPERARQLGLLGAKAQLTAGTADWPTFVSLLAQAVAVGGGILFAFLYAWLFGREFADRTVRGLLANPTPRWAIVCAKAVVGATWGIAITIWVLGLGLTLGELIGLPGGSRDVVVGGVGRAAAAAVLTIALQSMTAFFAGVGRGYIAALGWAVLAIFLAQIFAVLGWGAWFPFSVPAIVTGAAGPSAEPVSAGGVVIVALTAFGGLLATIGWWERADQTG